MGKERTYVIVRHLASEMSEETLENIFARYGKITEAKIVSGEFERFGLLKFSDEISMRDVVGRTNGMCIGGRNIHVEEAAIRLRNINSSTLNASSPCTCVYRVLKWTSPEPGYTAVYTDGSYHERGGGIGCIAISINKIGLVEVPFAFAAASSSNSAFEQEAKAMIAGLQLAIVQKITKVQMRSDCLDLIECINEPNKCPSEDSEHWGSIQKIKKLKEGIEKITFEHVYRELNQPADLLSRYITTPGKHKYFESLWHLPQKIKDVLSRDGPGCTTERFLGSIPVRTVIKKWSPELLNKK